jgi:hypothetical protein
MAEPFEKGFEKIKVSWKRYKGTNEINEWYDCEIGRVVNDEGQFWTAWKYIKQGSMGRIPSRVGDVFVNAASAKSAVIRNVQAHRDLEARRQQLYELPTGAELK